MVPIKHCFIFSLFIFHSYYIRSQNIELKNVLWGIEESKKIYVGVTNKFIVVNKKNDNLSYQSNELDIRLIGDTLILYARKIGKQMITASSDGIVKTISFNVYTLPSLYPELYFKVKNVKAKTTCDSIAIRLVSDPGSSIVDIFSIVSYQLEIGKKIFEIGNQILPVNIIAIAKESDQQRKIIIKKIWIRNNTSGALISLDTNTRCFIPDCCT